MKTITKNQYYMVHGLLALAERHNREMDNIVKALANILDEEDEGDGYYGHVSDAAYSNYEADRLLDLLEVQVEE